MATAQYAVGDSWYTNPLAFEPLSLHTGMGFLIPLVAAGVVVFVTDSDANRNMELFDYLGFAKGYKHPETSLVQNSFGFNFFLIKHFSVGMEVGQYYPFDEFNNTFGIAIRPFARVYFVNDEPVRVFFESGGGLVGFIDEFPAPTDRDNRSGTYINGTTKYGIGCELVFIDSVSFAFGVQHIHVSNGNTLGVGRNPSHDSNGVYVGIGYDI